MSELLLKRIAELEALNQELFDSLHAVKTMHHNTMNTTSHLQNFIIGRFEAR